MSEIEFDEPFALETTHMLPNEDFEGNPRNHVRKINCWCEPEVKIFHKEQKALVIHKRMQ